MKLYEKYIQSYTHEGRIGVLVEFGLKSAITIRSEIFVNFTRDIAMHIAAKNPSNIQELLNQKFVKNTELSINELIQETSAVLHEPLCINRFVYLDTETLPRPESDIDPPPKSPAVAMRVVK